MRPRKWLSHIHFPTGENRPLIIHYVGLRNGAADSHASATVRKLPAYGVFFRSFLRTSNRYSRSSSLIYAVFFSTANVTELPTVT